MTFEEVFDRTMGHEGGYSNDPMDPGGETNWGISKRSYPEVDIAALTREGARAIYFEDFWKPLAAELPTAMAFQLFDATVNHGQGNAIRFLQRAIGVADDGHWGPASKARFRSLGLSDVLLLFLAERLLFMAKLTTWDRFGRGWARRIAANLKYAAGDN